MGSLKKNMPKRRSLQAVFRRFLGSVCAAGAVAAAGAALCFLILAAYGVILPANYEEQMLEANREKLEASDQVSQDLIPDGRHYGVFSEDGTYEYGNMDEKLRENVETAYAKGEKNSISGSFLKYFHREDGVCIVTYQLKMQFANPLLRRWLPGAIEGIVIVFAGGFLLAVVWLIRRLSRKIGTELQKLQEMADRVREQDLEFGRPVSGIGEVDEVIESFVRMRDALQESLEQQWTAEERRRQQMRALTHDLKTPLTVIRGNSQLIGEAEDLREAKLYNGYLQEETDTLENYLQLLQEMLRSGEGMKLLKETILIRREAAEFKRRIRSLAVGRRQQLEVLIGELPKVMQGDRQMLLRSWENLVSNAVEYTSEGGHIRVEITGQDGMLVFEVEDDGKGFTEEELRCAAWQFYQGDKSRTSRNHYGMGLYIADSFAAGQGGRLILGNSEKTKGALVRMEIPIV